MSENKESKAIPLLEFIKSYWIFLVFLGSLTVTWAQFQSRVNTLESEVVVLQSQSKDVATHLASIDVSVAQINTSLLYIKNNGTR